MKSNTIKLLAALIGASFASVSSADVLVNNLNEFGSFTASQAGGGTGPGTIYASQFVTGAGLSEVLSATARLSNGSGWGVATYEAFIYTDDGDGPGSVVASFDSMPTIADGGGIQNLSFTSTLGIVLDPNTAYWFGVRNTTGAYIGWRATASDAEASTAGWSIQDNTWYNSYNAGSSWHDYSAFYGNKVPMYSLNGTSVPAPGSVALLAAGVAIASRRRRG